MHCWRPDAILSHDSEFACARCSGSSAMRSHIASKKVKRMYAHMCFSFVPTLAQRDGKELRDRQASSRHHALHNLCLEFRLEVYAWVSKSRRALTSWVYGSRTSTSFSATTSSISVLDGPSEDEVAVQVNLGHLGGLGGNLAQP
jgi:hypothetical protein